MQGARENEVGTAILNCLPAQFQNGGECAKLGSRRASLAVILSLVAFQRAAPARRPMADANAACLLERGALHY
jgi:hypothetical protein